MDEESFLSIFPSSDPSSTPPVPFSSCTSSSPDDSSDTVTNSQSFGSFKKLSKSEKFQQKMLHRKSKIIQKNSLKKIQNQEKFQQLTEEERIQLQNLKNQQKLEMLENLSASYHSKSHICIDLSYLSSCSECEIRSLATQIRLSYVELKKNKAPLALHLTSFDGQNHNHDKSKIDSDAADDDDHSHDSNESPKNHLQENKKGDNPHDSGDNESILYTILHSQGITNWKIYFHPESIEELAFMNRQQEDTSLFHPEQIVFLSPDAEEPLPAVLPHHIYVIGGIVDKNIKRCLTWNKASEYNFQVYRLPIQEYYPSSKGSQTVLNIDQVVRALCVYNFTQNWEDAIISAVPPRRTGEIMSKKKRKNENKKEKESNGREVEAEEGREELQSIT